MVKKISELKNKGTGDFALPKLDTLLNETFEISGVRFGDADLGKYSIVSVNGEEYRTFSEVLMKDLVTIEEYIRFSEDTVEVTLKKKGQYFIFE